MEPRDGVNVLTGVAESSPTGDRGRAMSQPALGRRQARPLVSVVQFPDSEQEPLFVVTTQSADQGQVLNVRKVCAAEAPPPICQPPVPSAAGSPAHANGRKRRVPEPVTAWWLRPSWPVPRLWHLLSGFARALCPSLPAGACGPTSCSHRCGRACPCHQPSALGPGGVGVSCCRPVWGWGACSSRASLAQRHT